MKKVVLLALASLLSVCAFAENFEKRSTEPTDQPKAVCEEAGASAFEVLVWASDAVDDLCNYFNGSWADTALTVYCSFGGDVYTCTAYKVVRAACSVNGAVRLTIQGDYEAALKSLLTASTKVYSVYKISQKAFKISD